MDKDIAAHYGQRLRVRACGLCWDDEGRLLLVRHKGIAADDFWAPPGGGVEFGESVIAALRREFREETGLEVTPATFRFACEFIQPPLHALELFYDVAIRSGELRTGLDPEIQIIMDVKFLSEEEWKRLPHHALHGIFRHVRSASELRNLHGFFTI